MDAMRSASSFFGLLTRLLTGYAHILAQPLRERYTLTRPGLVFVLFIACTEPSPASFASNPGGARTVPGAPG